jgi:hypothetical protein
MRATPLAPLAGGQQAPDLESCSLPAAACVSDPRLIYPLATYSQAFTKRVAFQLFEVVLLFASASRKETLA